MIELSLLLGIACILAWLSKINKIFTYSLILVLSLFSGLRTSYNDTQVYVYGFVNKIPADIWDLGLEDLRLGQNPGFLLYQSFIKSYISTDPQIFLLISAVITNILIIAFYRKYARFFSLTIFMYITSGLFVFSMAAIKQSLAMSIIAWSIPFALQRNWIKFLLLVLLAMTIHSFALIFLIIPLFIGEKIWGKKAYLLILSALVLGIFFTNFINIFVPLINDLKEIETSYSYFEGESINIFRVMVFGVTPVISWLYRKRVNLHNDQVLNLSINMSIISFIFMLIAINGGANSFGRMANYFELFTYVALPVLLQKYLQPKIRTFIVLLAIIGYYGFFYYQFGIVKQFQYNSIFDLW